MNHPSSHLTHSPSTSPYPFLQPTHTKQCHHKYQFYSSKQNPPPRMATRTSSPPTATRRPSSPCSSTASTSPISEKSAHGSRRTHSAMSRATHRFGDPGAGNLVA